MAARKVPRLTFDVVALVTMLSPALTGCASDGTPRPGGMTDATIPPLAGKPMFALPADTVTVAQPGNVGDAKLVATSYHASGAYDAGLATVDSAAQRWIEARAPQVLRPALVLDIDETALSNWEVLMANDYGRFTSGPCLAPSGPCGFAAWDLSAQSTPIEPTLALFRDARALGVSVFFITGRPESQRSATAAKLRIAGYSGYQSLFMVPDGRRYQSAADFKGPVRARIVALGYDIIANVGDQPSDLVGGKAERAFLLPDPFYRVP